MVLLEGENFGDIKNCLEFLNAKSHFLERRYLHEMPSDKKIKILRVYKEFKYFDQLNIGLELDGREVEFDHSDERNDFFVTLDVPFEQEIYYANLLELVSNTKFETFISFLKNDNYKPAWKITCESPK